LRNVGLLGLLCTLAVPSPGCGQRDKGPLSVDVQGEVTWNGRPLRKGVIVFDSEDGGGIPSQGLILDGKYSFKASPGPRIVRIQANRTFEEVGLNPQNLPNSDVAGRADAAKEPLQGGSFHNLPI